MSAIKVTVLPYMGRPAYPKHKRANEPQEIAFTQLHAYEQAQVDALINEFDDPCLILVRKVTHLASLLGCSEPEAERILFNRLGV